MPDLTVDEFLGNTRAISRDNAGVQDLTPDEFLTPPMNPISKLLGRKPGEVPNFARDLNSTIGAGVKDAASMVDMLTSGVVQMAANVFGNTTGRIVAGAQGASGPEMRAFGKDYGAQAADHVALNAPVSRLVSWILQNDKESSVDTVMAKATEMLGKGGKWIEAKTGIPAEDTELAINGIMAGLGLQGGRAMAENLPALKRTAKPGAAPRIEPTTEMPDVWQRPRAKAEVGATTDMTPEDFLAAKGELPQPDAWRRDRAKPAAVDATEFERPPVGETADVIPTGDAVELPGEIPVGKARELALEGRLASQVRRGVVPAALAATGLGLAAAYGGDKEDLGYAAAAGGALALGRGKGMTVAEIAAHSDAAPLRVFLEPSATVLNTVAKLPLDRFEFPKQMIEELAKRPEVTQAEKDVLGAALKESSGPMITAKELMLGVKKATQDWELKKVETDQFADYGLPEIGRQDPTWREGGGNIEGATTSIYRLPEGVLSPDGELGGANHFSDPDYFAHTRSFTENGIKHVVELQSDLAQKAGKTLTEAERGELTARLDAVEAKHSTYIDLLSEASTPGRNSTVLRKLNAMPEFTDSWRRGENNAEAILQRQVARTGTEMAELTSKLAESASTERIQPLLKNWYKRLVREELADSARKGEATARFATADTVAKVEGWPHFDTTDLHPDTVKLYTKDSLDRYEEWLRQQADTQEALNKIPRQMETAKADMAKAWDKYKYIFKDPRHAGLYLNYADEVSKFLRNLGGKPYTDPQGHTWIEVPTSGTAKMPAGSRVQMFGRGDQKLLSATAIATAAGAATAYLSSPENRAKNAAIGAAVAGLAMFAKSKSPVVADWAATTLRGVEHIGGAVSTRIGNISKPLLHRMREFERGVMTQTNNTLAIVAPFVERLRKVPKAQLDALNAAILTGRPEQIRALIQQAGDRTLQLEWERVRTLLAKTGQALKDTGRLKALVEDYYPRIVIDVPGLLTALGGAERSHLQKLLDNAERKSALRGGAGLSEIERSAIINKYLKSPATEGGGRPGFLKKRTIAEVTPELAKFYAPASESLPIYLRGVAKELERAKFFGESAVRDAETGVIDTDASIGNVVETERASGRVSDEQISELRDLLQSRFGPGERSMAGPLQTVRNLTNLGLLAHVTSALTQAGDIATAAYAYGILPTIKALQTIATNKPGRTSVHDIGLVNHITEELATGTRKPVIIAGRELSTAKFLEKGFKLSGFSLVDQLGKNTALNAALSQAKKLVQTESGIAKLRAKYGESFGSEFSQLVTDLRRGEMTEPVRAMLFSELSDIQPISKLEVPKAYLDNPNGRIMYMLRTFMIKQADIVRRDVIQEFRRGNTRLAVGNALRFSLALGISGATTGFITNWLLGRNDKLEWGDLPANMLRTFGWSQFVIDKMRKGGPIAAAGGTMLPPYQMWQQIMTQDPKAVQYMPVIGKLVFNHGLGGADKYNEQLAKREAAAAREASMTDFDRRERDRRREERKREKQRAVH
jgi:hypothetical protein